MPYSISVSANYPFITVYSSATEASSGQTVTVFARPYKGYAFKLWSDGETDNPRDIVISSDVALVAEYEPASVSDITNSYRCFIKDQLHLTDPPKIFLRVDSFDVKNDLMTVANSEIVVTEKIENVENGDLVVVYDPFGNRLYQGVITAIEDKIIRASQMQSFYKGEWIYEKGETPPTSFNNSWYFERFAYTANTPYLEDFEGLTPTATNTYNNDNISTAMNIANTYNAKATTYVWCSKPFISVLALVTDDTGRLYLNGKELCSTTASNTAVEAQVNFVKGLNELTVVYRENTGNDGWNVYYAPRAFDPYNPTKTYAVNDYVSYNNTTYRCTTAITTPEQWTAGHWTSVAIPRLTVKSEVLGLNSTRATGTFLEPEIKNIVDDYSDGKLVGSDYIDPLVAQRLGGIIVSSVSSTVANLTTENVGTTMDFEDFIYMLYDKYGIIFDFEINFTGQNYLTIKVPGYESMKLGNNMFAIKDMSPITKIEETNRLVIFDNQMRYRTTYVATKDDVVEEPSSTVNRFNLTNTNIVTSDDEINDLIAANLPSNMYNHKLSFTLVLKNNVYSYDNFKIGMPLEVWHDSDYYSTVLTGIEIRKESNKGVSEIYFTCGLVRQKLTQLLTLGKAKK